MPSPSTFALFLAAALTLLVIPGPAVLYVVSRSIEGGRSAGLVSVLGIGTGTLVHTAAAAAGVSSLLVASRTAFDVLRFGGAAYLIVLGLRRLLCAPEAQDDAPPLSRRRIYGQGVIVNVLNPKTALFVFAFLPQFVDVGRGHAGLQILFLGVVFALLGLLSDGAWAVAAGTAAEWIRRKRGFLRAQRWISGCSLVGLGVAAAVAGGHRSRG